MVVTNQKLFLHSAILSYLLLLGSGLTFTLFRYSVLPMNMVQPFYGTMAPFQGYTTENYELVAEGRPAGGIWQEINLQQYIPAGRGEFSYRGYNLEYEAGLQGEINLYELYAKKVQAAETRNGRTYDEVRLIRRRWPTSPAGYHYLNRPEFRTDDILFTLQ